MSVLTCTCWIIFALILHISLKLYGSHSVPSVCISAEIDWKIILAMNEIEFLPSSIGELTKLSDLALDFNKLQEYPVELSKLKGLNILYMLAMHSNPLENMPETKKMGLVELLNS